MENKELNNEQKVILDLLTETKELVEAISKEPAYKYPDFTYTDKKAHLEGF